MKRLESWWFWLFTLAYKKDLNERFVCKKQKRLNNGRFLLTDSFLFSLQQHSKLPTALFPQ